MLSSPKILKEGLLGDTKLTLEVRHDFPHSKEPHLEGIKQETVDCQKGGQEIIAEAECRAKEILDQARKKAENDAAQLAEKAREIGYREGHKKGYQEALEQANNEANKIRTKAQKVLQQAEEKRTETFNYLEQEIADLSITIAEKVLNQQLTIEPEIIMAIAREAIQLVKNRDKITIYHHPADQEHFEKYQNDLQRLLPAHATIDFIADDIITPGGCIIETKHGRVEATLESRWQAVFDSLGLRRP